MSKVIPAAVDALNRKIGGKAFDGVAKFVILGEGAIIVDAAGARAAAEDEEAEVTLSAEQEVFEDLLAGDLSPTTAFMTGKLKLDGSMPLAMKLGGVLSS
ncbi:SCP2 sterol-binding domain-containing protein [Pseudooceanicola sp. CBS1P-1]|uniref:Sterol carrier family protein n=1 Tax=Pseudooceanicola albus TaxID=2692189 RepID=A0A6L7G4L5_9RHOB|nr:MULTISPECIES: SCP2 sterol-binding domain-containing protein [Pseudooceanicola]MBT9383719.1 SCP2 sterol-binding domain-containing protein [Pseudooceanicola endophyticus]MXN17573.1 sterol carrier family protein [Pseudooceanicola albus]